MYILPLFLFTYRIRFIINQTWLTLTKSIEKSSTNYTIQHMHYQRIFHGGFNQTNLVLWILLFLSINLVKICQDWFRTYLIRQVNKNREISVYLWFFLRNWNMRSNLLSFKIVYVHASMQSVWICHSKFRWISCAGNWWSQLYVHSLTFNTSFFCWKSYLLFFSQSSENETTVYLLYLLLEDQFQTLISRKYYGPV